MKLSHQILIAFCIVVVFSIADSYLHYKLSLKVSRNIRFLSRSEARISTSNKIHKEIIAMQSSFRGYLLTNDSVFLKPYYSGSGKVPELIHQQKELIEQNSAQRSILDSIQSLYLSWIEYTSSLIKSKKKISDESALTYNVLFETKLKAQVGNRMHDKITANFGAFDKAEYNIRNTRATELVASINRTHTYSFIFITLTIIVGVTSTFYIINLISKRIKSMVLLADRISKGEFPIVKDDSNDELTGLSESLNIMSEKLKKNIFELEKRNAELDKFAYVVSHDLKAPVRGIHNVVKWIEEDLVLFNTGY